MNKTLIVLFVFVHASLSGKIRPQDVAGGETGVITEAQSFFESISPKDRDNFIVYYLAKGLRENQPNNANLSGTQSVFDLLVEPENFSSDLFSWTKKKFDLDDNDVEKLVSDRVVCLESGKCVRPGDVGSNCCLF